VSRNSIAQFICRYLGLLLPYILSIVGSKFCTQPGNSVLDPQQVMAKIEDVFVCVYICV